MSDVLTLLPKDEPLDLVLRGFGQSEILDKTGFDVGYHGNGVKSQIKGIDRFEYKVLYVQTYCTKNMLLSVLDNYANGLDKESVLRQLGIAGATIVKLHQLFGALDLTVEFKDADRRQRKGSMKRGTIEKYGVDNVFKLEKFQEQAAQTREEKYGGRYTFCNESVLAESARNTFYEHMQDEDFAEAVASKRKQTLMDRYGVDAPVKYPEFQEKVVQTCLEKYGVSHYMKLPESRQLISEVVIKNADVRQKKARQTCLERYGVSNHSKLSSRRQQQSERMSDRNYQQHLIKTKKKNGTLNTSDSETNMYQLLCDVFGESDVLAQYTDERYPFMCDFYIKSRDLFIELNAMWTHGGHWFNSDSADDVAMLKKWELKGSKFYQNALANWTRRDVDKRNAARQNNLNYVVLWDKNLQDTKLWIAMGCPDGYDWKNEYSWLPKRDLSLNFKYPHLTNGSKSCMAAAKAANGFVFYSKELSLWRKNPYEKWGTLQARLYANRYCYIGKLPDELSDIEILRGLSYSGLVRPYSVFQNIGMVDVLEQYDVKSIYDPCSGWGERLSTAGSMNVSYFGCDINQSVVDGCNRLIKHYKLTNCSVICCDSSVYDNRNGLHDCVFTCPPYHDVEVYTDKGAENLSYIDFLDWWRNVVLHSISSHTRVFSYQINTRYKDDMNQILSDLGWHLDKQIPVGLDQISHMNRSGGKKQRKTWDEIQVFVRDIH